MRGRGGIGGAPLLLPLIMPDRFVLDLCEDSVVGGDCLFSASEFNVDDDLLGPLGCSSFPASELEPLVFSFKDALDFRRKLRWSFKNDGIAADLAFLLE